MGFFGWIFGIVILVLDIIAIYDVVMGSGSAGHKILWTILIIIFPVLGLILYYLLGRSRADL